MKTRPDGATKPAGTAGIVTSGGAATVLGNVAAALPSPAAAGEAVGVVVAVGISGTDGVEPAGGEARVGAFRFRGVGAGAGGVVLDAADAAFRRALLIGHLGGVGWTKRRAWRAMGDAWT